MQGKTTSAPAVTVIHCLDFSGCGATVHKICTNLLYALVLCLNVHIVASTYVRTYLSTVTVHMHYIVASKYCIVVLAYQVRITNKNITTATVCVTVCAHG